MRLLLVLLMAGCGTDSVPPPPETAPGCNPLIGDDCLTPFPSSFYQNPDGTLAIPDGVLPTQANGKVLSPARLNSHKGVSPSTPFVVYFKNGVSPDQLPSSDSLASSILPTSPVQVIGPDGRVPVFAELDANALAGDRQALIIHPAIALLPATTYYLALVGLKDGSGQLLAPAPFVALRDETALSKSLMPLAADYENDVFPHFADVPRSSLTLAWKVMTAPAEGEARLTKMVGTALPSVPQLNWTITSMMDLPNDPHRLREVTGTFDVPSFLTDDSLTATLVPNVDGVTTPRIGKANFVVEIPQCAPTKNPIPVLVFGHGPFGDAPTELDTSYERQVGDYLCMVQIGTDWIGLSSADLPTLTNKVLGDFNQFSILTDRLQQSHVNAQVLTRLFLTRMKDDPAFSINGMPATDGKEVYYYGISDGGIQGGTYLALSQDVTRGVLDVPGCTWSLMMFRSADFSALKPLLDGVFPDPLDQQVLLAAIQSEFDYTDPAGFARDLLTSGKGKQVLIQESVNDAQVPNVATRILARTVGLPGLDLEHQVYGIPEMSAPLPSAYTQWDVTPMPAPPTGDQSLPQDNGAHEAIRRLTLLEAQLKAFLAPSGQVTQTCNGPCVCSLAAGSCDMPPGVN